MPPCRKNDILTLSITGLTHEGAGVARVDQYVLFIPGALPGDTCRVRVVKTNKSYGYGRLEQLVSASPDRVAPACPAFDRRCGGCLLQHLHYEAECAAKESQVKEALSRALGREIPLEPLRPAPATTRWRNKVLLPVGSQDGRAVFGFFRGRSHEIVAVDDCPAQPEEATAAARVLAAHIDSHRVSLYDETAHKGLVRGLFVRKGEATGQVMVAVIVNGQSLPHADRFAEALRAAVPGLASLQLCRNRERTNVPLTGELITLWGADHIEDRLLGRTFEISARSFYQVNHAQCEALYRGAADFAALTGDERLLDLYCGIGTIGLTMADRCRELVGVEVVPQAVEDARRCAAKNGVQNARFLCADAADAARQLAEEGFTPDVVILDPPRKGCGPALLATVATMAPDRIVYISCNPATLARDAADLEAAGYRLTRARPYDLFPRTGHVETLTLFSRP